MNITIKPYSNNAKKHTPAQIYKVALSIKNFGWQQPIVVDKEGVIIVGHARWEAYTKYKEEMNLPEPWVKVEETLTEEQVKAYRLADNLTASTDYDMDAVLEESNQLALGFQEILRFDPVASSVKDDKVEEKKINDEGMMAYLNMAIRQIVCHYQQNVYNQLISKCEQLIKYHQLENNSELFAKLVDQEHEKINAN